LLHSDKIKAFILISIVMHGAFVVLFGKVNLSSVPPPDKSLSLIFMSRETAETEIVQREPVWPMPARLEPAFIADPIWEKLDADVAALADVAFPESSLLAPKDTLIPRLDIAQLAGTAYPGAPPELLSELPPESKFMPTPEFALGPAFPGLFESD